MRTNLSTLLCLSSAALVLAGCASYDENPNYEFSSRYEGAAQVPGTLPVEATQVVYEPQTATPVQAESIEVYTPQPTAPAMGPSPTDTVYATQDVTGTPGYMAMQGQATEMQNAETQTASTPWSSSISGAQPVEYDYSQNLIVADAPIAAPDIASEIRILPSAGTAYVVQQGDTVYGLSRRNCVGIDVIRSMNAIDANYSINIGQTIQLPSSRC